MKKLIEWIETIEDTRQQAKVRHKLTDIIVIVLLATVCNADEWEEIADFAECYEEVLREYIALENGIPSHDTIRRVMGMINPQYMQQLYNRWNELINSTEGEKIKKIIAIDGKTVCGSRRKNEKAAHIVSAWNDEEGYCLGQVATDEKSNEITAIPELLKHINVKNQIVTIDAIGTQTVIAKQIRENKADYVLAVKENQKSLYNEISEYFADEEFKKEIKRAGQYIKTTEKAHSQTENREYYQTNSIKWLNGRDKWKDIKTIGMVEKITKKNEETMVERRYYISSIETDIKLFSKAVRQHWTVEAMHWHLDVTFKEDSNTTIDKIAVQNQNIIRKWSLSILKTLNIADKKISLKRKRYIVCMQAEKYIKRIMEI